VVFLLVVEISDFTDFAELSDFESESQLKGSPDASSSQTRISWVGFNQSSEILSFINKRV
jgi:hypothetical protein